MKREPFSQKSCFLKPLQPICNIKVLRNKKEREFKVELKNVQGNTGVVKNVDLDLLGAEFKELNDKERRNYNVSGGLKVTEVRSGLFADAGIGKGFVIVKVNGVSVKNIDELQKIVKQANNSSERVLFISGVTASGRKAYFSVELQPE